MVGRIPIVNVTPVIDLPGMDPRLPAKATEREPFPVRACVYREGHDRLGAEVVLIDPDGQRRPPVRMQGYGVEPDQYVAWVTPDVPGAWAFEVQAWSDPIATWQHAAGLKIPAQVDVELMFTEGRLLLERILAGLKGRSAAIRKQIAILTAALEAAADAERPDAVRLAAMQAPDVVAVMAAHPLRELLTTAGPFPVLRGPEPRAVRKLVRVLSALRGRDPEQAHGESAERKLQDRRKAPRRGGRDGLRRDLPATDPPDRRGQPQRAQQHADTRAGRPRLTVGDRLQGRWARRHPSGSRKVPGLRRLRATGQ